MPSHLASDVDMMRHSYDQWALGERERALAYYHKPDPDVDMLVNDGKVLSKCGRI